MIRACAAAVAAQQQVGACHLSIVSEARTSLVHLAHTAFQACA